MESLGGSHNYNDKNVTYVNEVHNEADRTYILKLNHTTSFFIYIMKISLPALHSKYNGGFCTCHSAQTHQHHQELQNQLCLLGLHRFCWFCPALISRGPQRRPRLSPGAVHLLHVPLRTRSHIANHAAVRAHRKKKHLPRRGSICSSAGLQVNRLLHNMEEEEEEKEAWTPPLPDFNSLIAFLEHRNIQQL